MINKYQELVKKLLENNSVANVMGTSQVPIYNSDDPVSKDSYQTGYNIKPTLLGSKIIKRKLPELINKKTKKRKIKK
jgi:hypothetical protein